MTLISVEHILYAPVPYKGYSIRAKSKGANVDSFKSAFKDWMIPFDQSMITRDFLEKVLIVTKERFYLARVFQAPGLDELKRSGVVSHIADVPTDLVQKNNFAITSVDSSMKEFIKNEGIPTGEIKPLKTPLTPKGDIETEIVRRTLPKDSARRILEATTQKKFKVFIIYEGRERDLLSYGLARMVSAVSPYEFIVASENIKRDVLFLHEGALIIGKKLPIWARIKGWTIINLRKSERSESNKSIDVIMKEIYGGDSGQY